MNPESSFHILCKISHGSSLRSTLSSALGSSERGHSVSSYDIVPLHLSHGSRSAEVVLRGMGWDGSYRYSALEEVALTFVPAGIERLPLRHCYQRRFEY